MSLTDHTKAADVLSAVESRVKSRLAGAKTMIEASGAGYRPRPTESTTAGTLIAQARSPSPDIDDVVAEAEKAIKGTIRECKSALLSAQAFGAGLVGIANYLRGGERPTGAPGDLVERAEMVYRAAQAGLIDAGGVADSIDRTILPGLSEINRTLKTMIPRWHHVAELAIFRAHSDALMVAAQKETSAEVAAAMEHRSTTIKAAHEASLARYREAYRKTAEVSYAK